MNDESWLRYTHGRVRFSRTKRAVHSRETTSLRQTIYTVLIGNRITVVVSFRESGQYARACTKSRLFCSRAANALPQLPERVVDLGTRTSCEPARVTPRWLRRWLNNEKVIRSSDPVDPAGNSLPFFFFFPFSFFFFFFFCRRVWYANRVSAVFIWQV